MFMSHGLMFASEHKFPFIKLELYEILDAFLP
jgi:hypothetical protein